jgi:hypothetical protein
MNGLITLVAALTITIATTLAFAQSRGNASSSAGYCPGTASRVHGLPVNSARLPVLPSADHIPHCKIRLAAAKPL